MQMKRRKMYINASLSLMALVMSLSVVVSAAGSKELDSSLQEAIDLYNGFSESKKKEVEVLCFGEGLVRSEPDLYPCLKLVESNKSDNQFNAEISAIVLTCGGDSNHNRLRDGVPTSLIECSGQHTTADLKTDTKYGQHKSIEEHIEDMHQEVLMMGREDNRIPLEINEDQQYNSVGTISCTDPQSGLPMLATGTIVKARIDGDIIITNEHAFKDIDTGVDYTDCKYNFFGDKRLPFNFTELKVGGVTSSKKDQDDWAVAKLEMSIVDMGVTKPIPLSSSLNSRETTTVDFIANCLECRKISIVKSCQLVAQQTGDARRDAGTVLHNCDSSGSTSGGALIENISGQKKIVAINKGFYGKRHSFREFSIYNHANKSIKITDQIINAVNSMR